MGPWQAGLEHEMRQARKGKEKLIKRKKGVAKLSVASNSSLLVLKLFFGFYTFSHRIESKLVCDVDNRLYQQGIVGIF